LGVNGRLAVDDGSNTTAGQVLTLVDVAAGGAEWVESAGLSSFGSKDCYVVRPVRDTSSVAMDGFYAKALYKYRDDNWDGYGVMYCRADGSIDDPFFPTAQVLHAACPWGFPDGSRIKCSTFTQTSPSGVVTGYETP
jgi:hypothetical protein